MESRLWRPSFGTWATRSRVSSRVAPLKVPLSWSTRTRRRPNPVTGRKTPPALSTSSPGGAGVQSSRWDESWVIFSVSPLSATQNSLSCLSRGAPRATKAGRALVATSNPAPRLVRTLHKNPRVFQRLGAAGLRRFRPREGHQNNPFRG